MEKFALIVAGGEGSRMNAEKPKQFIELAGKPILMHTLLAFKNYDENVKIVLVLPENLIGTWRNLCKKHHFHEDVKIAHGGENRFQSVKNGLEKISGEGIVFIHDAVRPFVSKSTLNNCFNTALKNGNALPVIPLSESLRYSEGAKNKALDRSKYYLVQTPQTFHIQSIKNAFKTAGSENFTDDASVFEHAGNKIFLVKGNRENIKITYPIDLKIATAILESED